MNNPSSPTCFHCGEKLRGETSFTLNLLGNTEYFCCKACMFAAETIVQGGLSQYYLSRTHAVSTVSSANLLNQAESSYFDDPNNLNDFSTLTNSDERSVSLAVEGIHCAACGWLIKNRLLLLDGITSIEVNLGSYQAHLRWQPNKIPLSRILNHLAELGYKARPLWLLDQNNDSEKQHKKTLKRLGVAGIGMMQVMMFSVGLYVGAFTGISEHDKELLRWVNLFISSAVLFYSGPPFFISAFKGLKAKVLNMDLPIAITIGSTYLLSLWATLSQQGEVYFDAITMFVFFLTLGRFLEASGRHKANQSAHALLKCLPQTTTRLLANEQSEVVSIHKLQPKDLIRIKPGATIPVDGRVIRGESSVDESLLTGEMNSKPKIAGDHVLGGSQNIEDVLDIEVIHHVQNSLLSGIMQLMERGLSEKPGIAVIADRVASHFVAVLLLVAAGVFITWHFVDPDRALWITLSVLVISCPCALSLATPIALTAASNALMKKGILITRGNVIEKLANIDTLIFDKTGTLTHGRFSLKTTKTLAILSAEQCLAIAQALENHSEHPIGHAFKNLPAATSELFAQEIKNHPNLGIEGEINNQRFRIGKSDFSSALYKGEPPALNTTNQPQGAQLILLASETGPLAWFELEDSIRPELPALMNALHKKQKRLIMLSGDPSPSALTLANDLGFDEAYTNYSPADKKAFVERKQLEGHQVIMIGDGINDAPVLAQANVAMAMGSGTDLAKTSADIVLLNTDLQHLTSTLNMADRTFRIIKQNTAWAVIYNALALPLAAFGHVEPYISTIGMSASSLFVVLNSLRLQNKD